jgi:HEAT repeat protein
LVLVMVVAVWPPSQPSYKGKRLRVWLKEYDPTVRVQNRSAEAEEAIRQIGTNALPTLLAMVRTHDSPMRVTLNKWLSKQKWVKFRFVPATELRFQGQAGYQVLGAVAKTQVPQLRFILTNDPVAQVRQCAAGALGFIGKDAASAAPALLITARDKDDNVRNSSFFALSRIHAPLEIVLSGLIAGLDDPFHVARENAAIALAGYGPLATNAIPALTRTRSNNTAAGYALGKIVPDPPLTVEPSTSGRRED